MSATFLIGRKFNFVWLVLGLVAGAGFFVISYAAFTPNGGAGDRLLRTAFAENTVVPNNGRPLTDLTWDGGGGDDQWSTAANWDPDMVPGDGMGLVFPESALQKTNFNDLEGLDLTSVTISGSAYNISGNDITISNGLTAPSFAGPQSNFAPGIMFVTQPQTFSVVGSADISMGGVINLNGFALTVNNSGNLEFRGRISGSGGITKMGTGTLILSGANNYQGTTQVNAGTLYTKSFSALGATGADNTSIGSGATLRMGQGTNENLNFTGGNLDSSGCAPECGVFTPVTLAANLTVSVPNCERITMFGGISDTTFGVTKIGGGTLHFNNATSAFRHRGATNVNQGRLLIFGQVVNSQVVLNGGELGGESVVPSVVATSGMFSGAGQFISSQSMTLNPNIGVHVGLYSNAGSDRIRSGSGQLNLGGARLTGTLFYVPAPGDSYTIAQASSALSGQFAQGSSAIIGNRKFTLTYNASTVTLTAGAALAATAHPFDFDGDSKTDIGIFRPGNAEWWYERSNGGCTAALQFGAPGDIPVPSDFTGDSRTDVVFFRPSSGEWFVLRSQVLSYFAFPFGQNGDKPVPADYDGDGKADAAVFRPSDAIWYIMKSTGGISIIPFGSADDQPVPADYDGDGKADIGIYRTNGAEKEWWYLRSSNGTVYAAAFGAPGDKAVPGDFTGDGKADIAFWRPSNGFWYVLRSEDSSYYAFPFGANTDIPAPGDYDGDSKFDPAVFRPSSATWFVNASSSGLRIATFGAPTDIPIASTFVP